MQRVAIARALINDPEILLADEPTGALDSKTSVQIMDLLSEIARSRLVIMVTHNPELAELRDAHGELRRRPRGRRFAPVRAGRVRPHPRAREEDPALLRRLP